MVEDVIPSAKKGIPFETSSNYVGDAYNRPAKVKKLLDLAADTGLYSRNGAVKIVVDEHGQTKCVATHFIPKHTNILYTPSSFALPLDLLQREVSPETDIWQRLLSRIDVFEDEFVWSDDNQERKDYFSKILPYAICIIALLKRMETTPEDRRSLVLHLFSIYWSSLPARVGTDWTEKETDLLKLTSLYQSVADSKRLAAEAFEKVVMPFTARYSNLFRGENDRSGSFYRSTIYEQDFQYFMFICSVITSRAFANDQLLPVIDFFNGKPFDSYNVFYEKHSLPNAAINKSTYHVVVAATDISAGEELFLEYAGVGNESFLLYYNVLPLDSKVIMHNPETSIVLKLYAFAEKCLLRFNPISANIREKKRSHIARVFNLPKVMVVTTTDLESDDSMIGSIRQFLIFLRANDDESLKTIQTRRLKCSMSPADITQLFLELIDFSLGPPRLDLIEQLKTDPESFTENMRSALFLHIAERVVVENMVSLFDSLVPAPAEVYNALYVSAAAEAALEELQKPFLLARSMQCMCCGLTSTVRLSTCSRCHEVFYCGPSCQKEHWSTHKKYCTKKS